jgi:ubiquinone/menaquinone biosynthesis C-methylase UbiE
MPLACEREGQRWRTVVEVIAIAMTSATQLAARHWNETPLYMKDSARYRTYPWLYEAAEFRSHAGQRLLEIGCGSGCDLLQFAKHDAVATGVDIADGHLELAGRRLDRRAQLVKADGRDLPFADGSFDYVYSHGVIHHSDEPERIASEILRVLRPGGRFNIHVYAKWSYSHFRYRQKFGRAWKLHIENSTAPVYIELYTAAKLRALFPGVPLRFRKYEFSHWQVLGRWIGFFLAATGAKPIQSTGVALKAIKCGCC